MLFQKNIYDVSGKFSKAFLKQSFSTFLKPGSISGVSEASLQMGFVIYYDKNAKVLYLHLWFKSKNSLCILCSPIPCTSSSTYPFCVQPVSAPNGQIVPHVSAVNSREKKKQSKQNKTKKVLLTVVCSIPFSRTWNKAFWKQTNKKKKCKFSVSSLIVVE